MKKVILAILDGVGVTNEINGNAFKLAKTPVLDHLISTYPHSLLKASGEAVGLPKGQMGNSEVGHLTIGAGRIIDQPLQKINKSIEDKTFFKNKEIISAIKHAKENNSKLHILGLLSDGGVHSHIDHIIALIKLVKLYDFNNLYIHVFLDGRDTLKDNCLDYLDYLKSYLKSEEIGKIATISGRYYSMDREEVWERTKLAYDSIVNGIGNEEKDYETLIKKSYKKEVYDEFIIPTIIDNSGMISDNDSIILANFRPDRTTQLFSAITNEKFDKFETKKLQNIKLVTMMPVNEQVICSNAFKHEEIKNTLGEVLSKNNYRVLRIAELSKFPHVTHFLDGDKDIEYENTKKVKIPRREVDTYDMYPEMSSKEVTNYIEKEINNFDFIIVNYANGDMVGHTGNLKAAIKSMEYLDSCIKKLYRLSIDNDFLLIVTADHGNCEEMLDENKNILTTHTTNPVYFVVCDEKYKVLKGGLSNIAPSILNVLNIKIPEDMRKEIIIKEDIL